MQCCFKVIFKLKTIVFQLTNDKTLVENISDIVGVNEIGLMSVLFVICFGNLMQIRRVTRYRSTKIEK
jgi:hypothetical protein